MIIQAFTTEAIFLASFLSLGQAIAIKNRVTDFIRMFSRIINLNVWTRLLASKPKAHWDVVVRPESGNLCSGNHTCHWVEHRELLACSFRDRVDFVWVLLFPPTFLKTIEVSKLLTTCATCVPWDRPASRTGCFPCLLPYACWNGLQ